MTTRRSFTPVARGGVPVRMIVVCVLALALAVTATAPAAGASNTIEVSQATYATDNSNQYDRNPSIINDGTDYWLFWTKADDTGGVDDERLHECAGHV